MKEFKSIATMLEEKKINAKKKRDEVKRLRDEANFEMRMQERKWIEENAIIVSDVREHYTNEQIVNKEYLLPSTPYRLNSITNDLKGSESERQFWYFERQLSEQANMLMDIEKRLKWLDERVLKFEDEFSFDGVAHPLMNK